MCFKSSVLGFGGRKLGLVLLITLSNALGPTDRDGRCPRLGGSDREELGGEAVEFVVGMDSEVVADEAETSELGDSTVPAESGGM